MDTVVLSVLRIVTGAAFFFFIPGFIFTVLVFPKRQDLTGLERVLVAVITSILASIADGTVLLITIGLSFATLVLSMFVVSVALGALAFVRWRGVPQSHRLAVPMLRNPLLLPAVAVTISLILALSGITLLLYPLSNQVGYSEFYVTDSGGQTVSYPTNVTEGTSSTLVLGITNHENGRDTYSGTVSLNNTTQFAFHNLTLSQGQHLERPIVISFSSPGQEQRLQFTLTDSFNKTYELHLWVNVIERL